LRLIELCRSPSTYRAVQHWVRFQPDLAFQIFRHL
jgi:hypothetical protein